MARRFIAASSLIGAALAQVEVLGSVCTSEIAYVNPILIEVAVATPTVIDVFGEVTLTVNDVPTSISTLTYGTRTETETYIYSYTTTFGSITTAEPIPTAGSFDTPFALAFAGAATKNKREEIGAMQKRDTLPNVNLLAGGSFTHECGEAVSYYLRNGSVYADGVLISTSPGSGYQNFIPTIPALEIIDFFSIADAILSWVNSDFADLGATFCATAEGGVYAVFDGTQTPDGCSAGALVGVPGANCPGFNAIYPASSTSSAVASSTASSTTSANSTMTTGTSSSTAMSSSSSAASSSSASSSSAASSSASSSSASSSSSTTTNSSTTATPTSSTVSSTSSTSITSVSSNTSTSTTSTVSAVVSDIAAALEDDAADEEAMKRVMRRRRNKLNPNGKIVRGALIDLDELEVDEDA